MKTIHYFLLILLDLIISISTVYSESEKKEIQTLAAPVWVKPANNSILLYGINMFVCTNVQAADYYELIRDQEPNDSNLSIEKFDSSIFSYFLNYSCTDRIFFIRAVNSFEKGPWSDKLTLKASVNFKDTLLSPKNNSIVKINDYLSWFVQDSTFLQIDTIPTFDSEFLLNFTLDVTKFFILSNLMPNTRFFWRISHNRCNIIGEFSDTWSFMTDSNFKYFDVPLLTFPNNNAIDITPVQPAFKWEVTKGNESYFIKVWDRINDRIEQHFYVSNDTMKNEIEFKFINDFAENRTYYWYVQSIYPDTVIKSNTFRFTTGKATNVDEMPDIQNPISITPNPASDFLNIQLPDEMIGNKIEIFNIMGIRIINEVVETKKLKMDIHTFPVGIYLIKTDKYSKLIIKN